MSETQLPGTRGQGQGQGQEQRDRNSGTGKGQGGKKRRAPGSRSQSTRLQARRTDPQTFAAHRSKSPPPENTPRSDSFRLLHRIKRFEAGQSQTETREEPAIQDTVQGKAHLRVFFVLHQRNPGLEVWVHLGFRRHLSSNSNVKSYFPCQQTMANAHHELTGRGRSAAEPVEEEGGSTEKPTPPDIVVVVLSLGFPPFPPTKRRTGSTYSR
eukprot:2700086-Rhodomonas_salina.1